MSDDLDLSNAARSLAPHGPMGTGVMVAHAVRLSPDRVVVPVDCACCGGIASRTVRESRIFDHGALLVPYCGTCHAHLSEGATRQLAVGVSSLLLALTLSLGLPLAWQPPGRFVYAALVALGALLPVLAYVLRGRALGAPHAARVKAVWFRLDGTILCASANWGERLARASGAEGSRVVARERVLPPWSALGSLVAILVTPLLYDYHFPVVRIVNVTDRRITVFVDGELRAEIDATSSESARAGISTRIAAGRHVLSAEDSDHRVVDSASVRVESGVPHLYAPGSDGTCFWLETTGYGQHRTPSAEVEALGGAVRFWAIPGVDVWFAPSPPASDDERSTGGRIRALRQARCDMAPAAARLGN